MTPMIVMEYFDLGTLQDLYDRKKGTAALKEPVVCQVIRQLAGALAYCLSEGVVHRDVKPGNIAIRNKTETECKIVLFDFGEAYYCHGTDGLYDPKRDGKIEKQTMRGVKGTPMTAAPEVFLGNPYVYKCDCWSVGVVAYFLLCGMYPWKGKNDAEKATAAKKTDWEFKPTAVWKQFDDNVRHFINNTIHADPAARMNYQKMLEHGWLNPTVPPPPGRTTAPSTTAMDV